PKPGIFRVEEGRRFHNDVNVKYLLPNDDEELDRLHLQHYMMRYIWNSNYNAPVDDLLQKEDAKVLDLGCGAGSWLFELATEFPSVSFTGMDISPVIPSTIKPRNISFVRGNVLEGLPFDDNTFDFVHQRFLVAAIPLNDWQNLVNELVRVLKPGGYLELMEMDVEFKPLGPSAKLLDDAFIKVMIENGQDPHIITKLRSFMETNGQLEDIVREEKFGPYDKSAGRLSQLAIENHKLGFTALKATLIKVLNISSEEYDELIQAMTIELSEYKTFNHTGFVNRNALYEAPGHGDTVFGKLNNISKRKGYLYGNPKVSEDK
ncbi:6682_t:CDS:2, partial [Funneliformis geosporum]